MTSHLGDVSSLTSHLGDVSTIGLSTPGVRLPLYNSVSFPCGFVVQEYDTGAAGGAVVPALKDILIPSVLLLQSSKLGDRTLAHHQRIASSIIDQ